MTVLTCTDAQCFAKALATFSAVALPQGDERFLT